MQSIKWLIIPAVIGISNFAQAKEVRFSIYNRTGKDYTLQLFYKTRSSGGYVKKIKAIAPNDQVDFFLPARARDISINYVDISDETAQKLDGRIFNVEDVNGQAEIPSLMKVLKD